MLLVKIIVALFYARFLECAFDANDFNERPFFWFMSINIVSLIVIQILMK